jgi:hypothetical protein
MHEKAQLPSPRSAPRSGWDAEEPTTAPTPTDQYLKEENLCVMQ